jgi:hypothetical protein
MIKLRRIRWVSLVAGIGKEINAYEVLVRKPKERT